MAKVIPRLLPGVISGGEMGAGRGGFPRWEMDDELSSELMEFQCHRHEDNPSGRPTENWNQRAVCS